MNTKDIFEAIDLLLPDSQIFADFYALALDLSKYYGTNKFCIILDDDEPIIIMNVDVKIEIITKAVFEYRKNIPFGTYKVLIAVGGIESEINGAIAPKYLFSTLHYNEQRQLITHDFHSEFR